MANNGPLKDIECFKPQITQQSELGEALRVLEEGLAYDEECTITADDMDMELEVSKIIERDQHLVKMNQKLREKLTHRIETIKSVLDKDYDELMEDVKNKSQKKMIGDYLRIMEEDQPEIVLIQKDENDQASRWAQMRSLSQELCQNGC